ncbi:MAG: hypothetical protein M0P61_16275 [Ignavibacteriaceae bacterium]|nr:hypothetical protein [Ignavibacteriaceae bacterium]
MKKLMMMGIFCLFLIVGCKKDSDNPIVPTSSNGLFHFKIGDQATVVIKEYSIKNGVDSLINQSEYTYTILRDTVFDSFTWYSYSVHVATWITNKNDGVWQADRQQNGSLSTFMLYKYPCAKGDTFNSLGGNVLVVTTDTTISVSAGTFKCIQYREIDQYSYEDIYISEGLGIVKIFGLAYEYNHQSKMIQELKSYSLK